jgi:predicted transcriptional regulator
MAHRRSWSASPAAVALIAAGGLTQSRIADLAETSVATVSRCLAGLVPMRPEILAVIRAAHGSEIAERIRSLAAAARHERLEARRVRHAAA